MRKPLKGFITYSHEDTQAKRELRKRLAVMEQGNELVTWDDGQLTPGDKALQADILKEVVNSNLLLYLVSAASLASKNCNKELAEALNSGIRVIPIILEYCDWSYHQLSAFEVLPHKGKPISRWSDQSEGWQNVVSGIRRTIDKMQSQANPSSGTSEEELRAELVFQCGNVQILLGQLDRAIEIYSDAVELRSRHVPTYNNRGVAYLSKSKLDNAIADFSKAIELHPQFSLVYYNRGIAYDKKENFGEAIVDYTWAITLKSDSPHAYYNRGLAYSNKGEFNKAITDYTKAITLKLDYADAYMNRGNIYQDRGEFDCAVRDFTKVIELNSHDADAYYNRGNAYKNKAEFDRAIKDFNIAIQLNPSYVKAHNNRGMIYGMQGKFDHAILDFDAAVKLEPDYVNAYMNRGTAYIMQGELDKAISDYDRAIELNPEYAEAYSNRGNAYCEKGEMDKAIADYSQAIVQKPKVAESYYTRGEAFLRIGKWVEAQRDLTAAILQGVDIVDVFHSIHGGMAAFEEKTGVKFPQDIVDLLTPREGPFEIDKETRVALGMKYYENGELSSGLAARLAGVSRTEFMFLMKDYGLSPFGTAEDLKAELEDAHKISHQ